MSLVLFGGSALGVIRAFNIAVTKPGWLRLKIKAWDKHMDRGHRSPYRTV